jgi:uncharacterized protein YciI
MSFPELVTPETVAEAVGILSDPQQKTLIFGGGTLVQPLITLGTGYANGTFLVSGRQKSGAGGFILAAPMERSQLDSILANDPFGQNKVADYEVIEVTPTMADERLSFLVNKT